MWDGIFTVGAIIVSVIAIILAVFLPRTQGPRGPTGNKGSDGPAGSNVGLTGPRGPTGPTGPTGYASSLVSKSVRIPTNPYTIQNTTTSRITGTNFYWNSNNSDTRIFINESTVYVGDVFTISNYGNKTIYINPVGFLNITTQGNSDQEKYYLNGSTFSKSGSIIDSQTRSALIMITSGNTTSYSPQATSKVINIIYSIIQTDQVS